MPGSAKETRSQVWLSSDWIDGWKVPKCWGRDEELVPYGNTIEATPTLGTIYHLPHSQTPGLTKSLFELPDLDLTLPSLSKHLAAP
ncbi:MAG: transposase [Geminicoccaceae bacterium]